MFASVLWLLGCLEPDRQAPSSSTRLTVYTCHWFDFRSLHFSPRFPDTVIPPSFILVHGLPTFVKTTSNTFLSEPGYHWVNNMRMSSLLPCQYRFLCTEPWKRMDSVTQSSCACGSDEWPRILLDWDSLLQDDVSPRPGVGSCYSELRWGKRPWDRQRRLPVKNNDPSQRWSRGGSERERGVSVLHYNIIQ